MYSLLGILYYFFCSKNRLNDKSIIERYVQRRISLILAAARGVKAYDRYEINGNDIGLDSVDILAKHDYRSNKKKFLSRRVTSLDMNFRTSGSSGMPMAISVNPLRWIVEQATVYRHWKMAGYKFRQKGAMIRSYAPKENEPLIKYSWSLNTYYYSPFHMTEENMKLYYDHMRLQRVEYLRGYPSSLAHFASFCIANNYKLPHVKFALVSSEVLTSEYRKKIEKAFDIHVFNYYGQAEQIVSFGNCQYTNRLHVFEDYGFAEFIPTPTPHEYRIIGTNLHNTLTPLLRYDTGDLAYISDLHYECRCGFKGRTVDAVIGRSDMSINDNAGNSIPSVNFYTMMQGYVSVEQWQIVISKDKSMFTLNIMGDVKEDDVLEILNGLKIRLNGSNFQYNVKIVNDLIKISEGKIPVVYYEK